MKINQLLVKSHGPYTNERVINFTGGINPISGTDVERTVLFNILKHSVMNSVPGIKVSFEGDISDFKRNLNLIFIDEEQIRKTADSMRSLTANMSIGEKCFWAFNSILSVRASLKKDLPLIMNANLFAILDSDYRLRLIDKLESLNTQIIIFEKDFKEN